jgi:Flp pilus assembly secretin CpaC
MFKSVLYIAAPLLFVGSLATAQAAFEGEPIQVNVGVKVVEFQTMKGKESGLSAYFKNLQPQQALRAADLTFPASTMSGLSIFLDQLGLSEGELEVSLQALVNENRAFILSRPNVMVMVKEPVPTYIQTGQRIPYESNVIAGNTPVQVTMFMDTGVMLKVAVPEMIDDDGDWSTTEDTFIKVDIEAEVKEEGQRIVVALDDTLANGGIFSSSSNALSVPEFVNRRIKTTIWVRHGQVLILGGLYRDVDTKDITALPWLAEAESGIMGMVSKLTPGKSFGTPIANSLGNKKKNAERRELVFMLKAESWYPGLDPALMQLTGSQAVSAMKVINEADTESPSAEKEKEEVKN